MLTSVTAETINNLCPDAGIVVKNLDLEGVTDAASLLAKVEAKKGTEDWVGVTDGGVQARENLTTWTPTHDYKRMNYVGGQYFDNADPTLSFTLVEFKPGNIKIATASADVSGDKLIKVQPRAHIRTADYIPKLTVIMMNGPEGLYIVEGDNALCTKGVDVTTGDKAVAKLAVEFHMHKGSLVETAADALPMRYYFAPAAAEAAQTASTEQTDSTEQTA